MEEFPPFSNAVQQTAPGPRGLLWRNPVQQPPTTDTQSRKLLLESASGLVAVAHLRRSASSPEERGLKPRLHLAAPAARQGPRGDGHCRRTPTPTRLLSGHWLKSRAPSSHAVCSVLDSPQRRPGSRSPTVPAGREHSTCFAWGCASSWAITTGLLSSVTSESADKQLPESSVRK